MPIRWMTQEDARDFLAVGTEGRLATCNHDGQPYITPLNYVFREGRLYFHCKLTGRKLDNIAENNRVCFEVSKATRTIVSEDRPCACATRYSSVLVFGRARVVADIAEKTTMLNLLVRHLAAGRPFQPVSEQQAQACAVVEICLEEISGKMNVDPE